MSKKTKGRKRNSHREQPQYLSLEPRQLLATITVDTVFDNSNPSDGRVSIREAVALANDCLLYTSPSPRDKRQSRMPSSA